MYTKIVALEITLSKKNITSSTSHFSKVIESTYHLCIFKLGLFKQFVKALDKDFFAFAYLAEKFSSLSQIKIKKVSSWVTEFERLYLIKFFNRHIQRKEKFAYESFKKVCDNFLGKHRLEDYVQVINNLLYHYYAIECNMSLKFMCSNLIWIFCGESW